MTDVGLLSGLRRRNARGWSPRDCLHSCSYSWMVRSFLRGRLAGRSICVHTTWSRGDTNILRHSLRRRELLMRDWLSWIEVRDIASFNIRRQLMLHVIVLYWKLTYPLRNHRMMRLYVVPMHCTVITDILHLLILIKHLRMTLRRL